MQGKIIKGIAGFYYIHVNGMGIYECKAKGIFRNWKIKPLVGDNVTIDILDEDNKIGNIIDILQRNNELIRPAVMVNLLGEPGYVGQALYNDIEKCLSMDGVYPHIYGKKETKPYRKMGHVTIVDKNLTMAIEKARIVQKTLKVISWYGATSS